jgi:GH24 family phage-related lysozyme (muramidase)
MPGRSKIQLAERHRYLEIVGVTPPAFEVLIAVIAYELHEGKPAPSGEIRRVLKTHDLQLAELTKGMWLTAEGASNGPKLLTARDRAWRMAGVARTKGRAA